MNSARPKPWRSFLAAAAVLGALSLIAVEPPAAQERAGAGGTLTDEGGSGSGSGSVGGPTGGGGATAGPGGGTGGRGGSGGSTGGTGKVPTGTKLACKAGQNGGSTDTGVTGGKIRLAATNVRSGSGSSFLGTAYIGMQAAIRRVNAKGGVCGRLLDLKVVDDGWDAPRGLSFIKNFIDEDYFALPVVPSSEGLTLAIGNGTIQKAGIPVVGTDGMLKEQYFDSWVWPVATSTVSTMRIMAEYAIDAGAQSFGIVYDTKYRFGVEGAAAFSQYIKDVTGSEPKKAPLTPGKSTYGSEAQKFTEDCGSGCDFVALLLDPTTATTFISSSGNVDDGSSKKKTFGRVMTAGAQPLFNQKFARECGGACDGMLVWTGYNPPIGRLGSLPDVAQYVNDVNSVAPGVDTTNQFLEGAYLGMQVFIEALEKVGPNLTREGLRDVLNTMTYQSDIATPLRWTTQNRFANQGAQAFRILTASNSFIGFGEANTGFLKDPQPGRVPKD